MMFRWAGKLKAIAYRRRNRLSAGPAGNGPLQAIRYLVANEACAALDQAMRRGDDEAARRAIARGLAVDPNFTRLTELRAWYHLGRHEPHRALELLESESDPSPRMKLMLQLVRLQAGRKAMAHLELNAWARQADCPDAARLLLATLDMEAGHMRDAHIVLTSRAELATDPLACRMLILLELAQDSPQAARRAATILLHRLGRQERTRRFVTSLGLADHFSEAELPIEMVDQLAGELRHRHPIIPSLVAVQRCQPDRLRIELLRRAVARIVDELADPMGAIEALTALAELAGDIDEGCRWARRGLKLQPMNATLAMALDRLQSAPADDTRDATEDLRRVAQAHPEYADVQRALVLRYHRRGMTVSAQRVLRRWLKRHADHPLAVRTQQELAA